MAFFYNSVDASILLFVMTFASCIYYCVYRIGMKIQEKLCCTLLLQYMYIIKTFNSETENCLKRYVRSGKWSQTLSLSNSMINQVMIDVCMSIL